MKKIVLFTCILLTLALCACTSEIVQSGGVVVRGTPAPTTDIKTIHIDNADNTADVATSQDQDDIVYITKSGSKYHTEDCIYLKKSKIPILREQAIREGKQPCSKCCPDG